MSILSTIPRHAQESITTVIFTQICIIYSKDLAKPSNGVIITLPDFQSHKDILQEIVDKGTPIVYLLAPKDVEPRAIANIGSNMFEGVVALQRLNINASDKVVILEL